MKHYTTLLLDIDGTLLDFDRSQSVAVQEVYTKYGIPCTKLNMETYFEVNHKMWKQLEKNEITKDELIRTRFLKTFEILNLSIEHAEEVSYDFKKCLGKQHIMLDGALDSVKELSKEYDLVVITNGNKETQRSRLEDSGLMPYMSHVFISDEMGCQKPMKEFFDLVLSQVEEKNSKNLLVVGDTLSSDILGANNAQLDSCWINAKGEVAPNDNQPTFEIPSICKLNEKLKETKDD